MALAYALAGGYGRDSVDMTRAKALAERYCLGAPERDEVGPACVILAQITPEPKRMRELLARACDYHWWGIKHSLYGGYWLPGQPSFHTNCYDRQRLCKAPPRRGAGAPPGAGGLPPLPLIVELAPEPEHPDASAVINSTWPRK